MPVAIYGRVNTSNHGQDIGMHARERGIRQSVLGSLLVSRR
jgi:hypothetical protein